MEPKPKLKDGFWRDILIAGLITGALLIIVPTVLLVFVGVKMDGVFFGLETIYAVLFLVASLFFGLRRRAKAGKAGMNYVESFSFLCYILLLATLIAAFGGMLIISLGGAVARPGLVPQLVDALAVSALVAIFIKRPAEKQ